MATDLTRVPTRHTDKVAALARFGYAARGSVYLIVGGLAVLAAVGSGGETTDTRGALQSLLDEPFGEILLGMVALGLVGFAVWRLIEAVLDPERRGRQLKAIATRTGFLISAATYLGLAIFALSLIFGWGGNSGGERSSQDWTAWLLAQPFGPWLVGGIGAVVVAVGLTHFYRAYMASFRRYLLVPQGAMRWMDPLCRFGLAARGVVFILIGGFLILAALQFDASEARGLGGALRSLQGQPFGRVLLGTVALGLVAFGLYSLIEAMWRRIRPAG